MSTKRLVHTNHKKFERGEQSEKREHDEGDEAVSVETVGGPMAN